MATVYPPWMLPVCGNMYNSFATMPMPVYDGKRMYPVIPTPQHPTQMKLFRVFPAGCDPLACGPATAHGPLYYIPAVSAEGLKSAPILSTTPPPPLVSIAPPGLNLLAAAAVRAGAEQQQQPPSSAVVLSSSLSCSSSASSALQHLPTPLGSSCESDAHSIPSAPSSPRLISRSSANNKRAPRQYQCDACPKVFSCSSNLKRHQCVHTGNKPYKCEYCPTFFSNSSNRRKHERTHLRASVSSTPAAATTPGTGSGSGSPSDRS